MRATMAFRFSPPLLRALREERGDTPEKLAARVPCHPVTLKMWESGHRTPSLQAVCKLASALKCEPGDLFERVRGAA